MKLAFGLLMIPFASYAILWALPGAIFGIVVAMGSYKHIIFLDKQLSGNLNKLYSESGQLLNPMFTRIGTRFMGYCISYPFIRHRATTNSIKFRVFMWVNALGFWSWIIFLLLVFITKMMGLDYAVH